jgi:hypothetical protein
MGRSASFQAPSRSSQASRPSQRLFGLEPITEGITEVVTGVTPVARTGVTPPNQGRRSSFRSESVKSVRDGALRKDSEFGGAASAA